MALFQFNNYIKRPKLAELITIWRQPLPPTLHYFWKGTLSINFVSTVQVKAQPGCYICCLALLQLWHFVNLLEGQTAFYAVCDPAMIQSLTFRELTWGTTCFLCRLWPCYDPVKYSPRSSYISNIHLNNIFWIHIGNQKLFSSGTLTKGLYTFLFPPY